MFKKMNFYVNRNVQHKNFLRRIKQRKKGYIKDSIGFGHSKKEMAGNE